MVMRDSMRLVLDLGDREALDVVAAAREHARRCGPGRPARCRRAPTACARRFGLALERGRIGRRREGGDAHAGLPERATRRDAMRRERNRPRRGMDRRRVEDRHAKSALRQQHADLGAAEDDAVGPRRLSASDDGKALFLRGRAQDAAHELLEDDRVDDGPVAALGHDDLDAELRLEPALIEVLFHHVSRREQQGPCRIGGSKRRAVASTMWISGTAIAAATPGSTWCIVLAQMSRQSAPAASRPLRRPSPACRPLRPSRSASAAPRSRRSRRNAEDLRRMQPAQTPAHALVEQAIVDRRGFTAHSAEEADRPHHRTSRPFQLASRCIFTPASCPSRR